MLESRAATVPVGCSCHDSGAEPKGNRPRALAGAITHSRLRVSGRPQLAANPQTGMREDDLCRRNTMDPMIDPAIRAVAFDAVGTLIHPDPPAGEVYAAVGPRFGSPRAR